MGWAVQCGEGTTYLTRVLGKRKTRYTACGRRAQNDEKK